jgi:hypothetical protein
MKVTEANARTNSVAAKAKRLLRLRWKQKQQTNEAEDFC